MPTSACGGTAPPTLRSREARLESGDAFVADTLSSVDNASTDTGEVCSETKLGYTFDQTVMEAL